ncbi:MAG TPA: glycine cleavage system protein GcvH [Acidiferrobacterales bacterium]|nr:glycine cleavage system protein GcvH [Acidiferrobacterales bacterium]
MSKTPNDLHYTKSHEWVKKEADGTVTVGITDHAQGLLGDMVFVELPKVGTKIAAGKECGVVESVKAASDVYAPIAGEITAVNTSVSDAPESVNKDAYGAWMFKLRPSAVADIDKLLDAKAYEALVASEAH